MRGTNQLNQISKKKFSRTRLNIHYHIVASEDRRFSADYLPTIYASEADEKNVFGDSNS